MVVLLRAVCVCDILVPSAETEIPESNNIDITTQTVIKRSLFIIPAIKKPTELDPTFDFNLKVISLVYVLSIKACITLTPKAVHRAYAKRALMKIP
jgi:hypothetical protein